MGVSEYKTLQNIPEKLKSSLTIVEKTEEEPKELN